jgi:hypothetical protein
VFSVAAATLAAIHLTRGKPQDKAQDKTSEKVGSMIFGKLCTTQAALAAAIVISLSAIGCSKKKTAPTDTGAAGSTGAAGASSPAGAAGAAGAPAATTGGSGSTCVACELAGTNNAAKTCGHTSSTADKDTSDASKFGCAGFAAADSAACNIILSCLRSSHCANGDDPIPCLCGGLDPTTCASKSVATLPGVCGPQYVAAANGGDVLTLFFSADSPIGVANNLYTCDIDAHCACP